MEMRVRAADRADLGFIETCAEAAYGPYEAEIGIRPAPLDADYGALVAAGSVHVISFGDEPQGFIVLSPGDTSNALLIENVAVMPNAQGRGIGRRLLAFAEARARALGLSRMTLYTHGRMTRNIQLYRRLGYGIAERRHEDGFDRVYMYKDVGRIG